MKKTLRTSLILLAVFALVACAGKQVKSFKAGSYRALHIAGTTYDTGMTTIAELQRADLISDETRAEVNKLGNIYHDAYHSAVEALKVFAETGNEDDYENIQKQLVAVGKALGEFISFVNPILMEHGMEALK